MLFEDGGASGSSSSSVAGRCSFGEIYAVFGLLEDSMALERVFVSAERLRVFDFRLLSNSIPLGRMFSFRHVFTLLIKIHWSDSFEGGAGWWKVGRHRLKDW
jgi:hypothetical protein